MFPFTRMPCWYIFFDPQPHCEGPLEMRWKSLDSGRVARKGRGEPLAGLAPLGARYGHGSVGWLRERRDRSSQISCLRKWNRHFWLAGQNLVERRNEVG